MVSSPNFREPFFSKEAIETLLSKADIVKTNEDELAIMADWYGIDKEIETATAFIKDLFNSETTAEEEALLER